MLNPLYSLLLYLLLPWVGLRLLVRGLRNPAYWRRIPERFGFVPAVSAGRVIWIHAVSVGEVRAATPLIRALEDRYPDCRVLVTCMTPTGSATVRELFADRVAHCYVPYDYPSAVRRFLNRTLFDDCFRAKVRETWYTTIEQIQRDLGPEGRCVVTAGSSAHVVLRITGGL